MTTLPNNLPTNSVSRVKMRGNEAAAVMALSRDTSSHSENRAFAVKAKLFCVFHGSRTPVPRVIPILREETQFDNRSGGARPRRAGPPQAGLDVPGGWYARAGCTTHRENVRADCATGRCRESRRA